MSQRFFKASLNVYETVLSSLDSAWGFPKNGFAHCFLPLGYAPQKGEYAYLAIQSADAEMEPAASMLPNLLASGQVTKVTIEEYRAAMPEL